jgi:hypothetical protein
MSALAAVSMLLLAHSAYSGRAGRLLLFFSLVPEVFLSLWLVLLFRANQTNPVLAQYVYQGLAIVGAALGFYFTAGYVYGKPAPGKAAFSFVVGVFFCAVALADDLALPVRAIYGVLLAFHLSNLWRFLPMLERRDDLADLRGADEKK